MSTIYWNAVCGNETEDDAFWSDSISWNTTVPDLTSCLQNTVVPAIPFLYLWLVSVFYIPSLAWSLPVNRYKAVSRFNSCKIVLSLVLCSLCAVDLVTMVTHHVTSHQHQVADLIRPCLQLLTYLLSAFLIRYEFRKGVYSGGVLFFFWGLTLIVYIIPFRSYILRVVYDQYNRPIKDRVILMTTFYVSYATILVQFVCHLFSDYNAMPWAENGTQKHKEISLETEPLIKKSNPDWILLGDDYKPCPLKYAPFWQRITFLWITRMIIKGYRTTLNFRDLWGLMPTEKAEYIIANMVKYWQIELKKTNFNMVVKHRNNPHQYTVNTTSTHYLPESDLNHKTTQSYGSQTNHSADIKISYPKKEDQRFKYENEEVKTAKIKRKLPSVYNVIVKVFGWTYMIGGINLLVYTLLNFLGPIMLGLIISFISSADTYTWRGYMYVTVLFVTSVAKSLFNQWFFHISFMTGLRLRTAVVGMVYRKALRMNSVSRSQYTVGEIVNLMSVDAQKLQDAPAYLHYLWNAVFTIGISIYFLWQQLGPSVLVGLGFLLITIPLNMIIVRINRKFQVEQMTLKDERLKMINEVLSGIKVLKLYGWETLFRDRILAVREKELKTLWVVQMCGVASTFIFRLTPYMVGLLCFATYTLSAEDHVLDANKAFVSLSLFAIMQFPLVMIPAALTFGIQAYVSVKRINAYLRKDELDSDNVQEEKSYENVISVENATFSWIANIKPALTNITMSVPEGKLVAVVGQVGSGKSSLVSALLGDMEVMAGQVRSRGTKAYVPQQAWIQNASLQDNILFGKSIDVDSYQRIIDACALTADLAILPGGDQIEIGEKGINLSGGQKQRVSLARAVYQNSDIYLLDDPLSAVDAHVGKHIFEQVIGPTGILKHKTRLLVTNAVTFLPQADLIICLKHGHISEMGEYNELLSHNGAFNEFIETYMNDTASVESDKSVEEIKTLSTPEKFEVASVSVHEEEIGVLKSDSAVTYQSSSYRKRKFSKRTSMRTKDSNPEIIAQNLKENKNLTEEETAMSGNIKLSVFVAWIKSCGVPAMVSMAIFYTFYLAAMASQNIWLGEWSNEPPTANGTQNITVRNYRLGVYGGIGIVLLITNLGLPISMAFAVVRSSKVLHHELLVNIVRAPMSFFDTTPLGRIINRFAKDVDVVDVNLPQTLRTVIALTAIVMNMIIVISYSTHVFVYILLPLLIFYVVVQRSYVSTTRQLMRIDSVKRSPIFVHFSESITGASSIRAYRHVDRFIETSDKLIDENQMAYFPNIVSQRWLGVTLDFISNLVVLFTGMFAVVQRDTISPGLAGLALSNALQCTYLLNIWVRVTSELENYVVSVERIHEYAGCPKEAPSIVEGNRPASNWPGEGRLRFQKYATRYRPGLDLVLKDISCDIAPGEQIGVVGRTGAGKSSMTLALFRIIEAASGKILVDGTNISNIGLQDLRSKITIIPQDPVLFTGTIRLNLDPFEQYTETALWQALELAHLKSYVSGLPNRLQHVCSEGGDNLSVGQRQLVCLARALLRRSKVLVLDEATAAVDLETDDLIQTTIRSEFKDCTVITIAHRLNTIMDYDRVMVLDKGNIIEMDTPSNLLGDKDSVFYSMAHQAGLVT